MVNPCPPRPSAIRRYRRLHHAPSIEVAPAWGAAFLAARTAHPSRAWAVRHLTTLKRATEKRHETQGNEPPLEPRPSDSHPRKRGGVAPWKFWERHEKSAVGYLTCRINLYRSMRIAFFIRRCGALAHGGWAWRQPLGRADMFWKSLLSCCLLTALFKPWYKCTPC